MFGIDGIEFLIILIIIIVVVGPKDLPKMMRAFGQATTKMRKTAMEFRRHFDEAMREAELGELSETIKQVQKLDPRKNLTEIFDPIREVTSDIKASLSEPATPLPSSPPSSTEEVVPQAAAPAPVVAKKPRQPRKKKSLSAKAKAKTEAKAEAEEGN